MVPRRQVLHLERRQHQKPARFGERHPRRGAAGRRGGDGCGGWIRRRRRGASPERGCRSWRSWRSCVLAGSSRGRSSSRRRRRWSGARSRGVSRSHRRHRREHEHEHRYRHRRDRRRREHEHKHEHEHEQQRERTGGAAVGELDRALPPAHRERVARHRRGAGAARGAWQRQRPSHRERRVRVPAHLFRRRVRPHRERPPQRRLQRRRRDPDRLLRGVGRPDPARVARLCQAPAPDAQKGEPLPEPRQARAQRQRRRLLQGPPPVRSLPDRRDQLHPRVRRGRRRDGEALRRRLRRAPRSCALARGASRNRLCGLRNRL
mmetsp:Transcript_18485/g.60182  ORF Transcript_18485/g.60182 Transcript_18485/m.60182 type:complete len:319 (-) Transcript_18485:688-1644(-)